MLGPFATASRRTPPFLILHCHSPGVATVARHGNVKSMSTTTTTTTTTRDIGDSYGRIEWDNYNGKTSKSRHHATQVEVQGARCIANHSAGGNLRARKCRLSETSELIEFGDLGLSKQEAFEKCWAHSPLRAAARPNFTLPFTRCRYCRTPTVHRCPRRRQRQRQRQRVTEGTAMAPWNGPNKLPVLPV